MLPMADLNGMDLFLEDLKKYENAMTEDNIADVLMAGGEALAADVRRLPKPRRSGGGYTHMLDSVHAMAKGAAVQVGWGQYYGYFVEHGTRKMKAQPHLISTWNQNKDRYVDLMRSKLFEKIGG